MVFYLFCFFKKTGFCTIEAGILGQDRLTYCAAFSNLGVGVSIEFKDLFAECKMDLAAGGCAPENMPNLALWRKVWNAEFPNLRRRLFKKKLTPIVVIYRV